MNRHRILPLAFTLTFALFVPLLALGGPTSKPVAQASQLSKLAVRVNRGAAATWMQWHEKNENYTKLVGLDQR